MITIFGIIGKDVYAKDILPQIQNEKSDTVKVLISSKGGNVFDGLAIYDGLKACGKKIEISIMGQAASAASIIAMAGDKIQMGEGALLMIHNASVSAGGNVKDLERNADTLRNIDKRLISIYQARTGLSEDQISEMMSKETYMSSDEALKNGFITETENDLKMVALAADFINEKGETKMAKLPEVKEDEKVSVGMLTAIASAFGLTKKEDPKNMEEEPKEPSAMEEMKKAMEEKDAKIAELEQKVSAMEETQKTAMKESEEEATAKQEKIFDAMAKNKITLAEGKDYFNKSLEEVEELDSKAENATGRGPKGEPNGEPADSKYEQWKAMKDAGDEKQYEFFNEHKEEILAEA